MKRRASTNWKNHAQWRAMRMPRKTGPSFPTSCQHKVPRNKVDQTTAADLSAQFRAGAIYAYWYDKQGWWVCGTRADWDAVSRDGTPDPTSGPGPSLYQPSPVATRAKKPGKAELLAMLRRIHDGTDWEVEEIEQLLATA